MQPIFQYRSFSSNDEFVAWQKEQSTDFTITQILPTMFSSEAVNNGTHTFINMGILVVYYQQ